MPCPAWLAHRVVGSLDNTCDRSPGKFTTKILVDLEIRRTDESSLKKSQSSQSLMRCFSLACGGLSHPPLLLRPLVPVIKSSTKFHRIASANPSGGTAAFLHSLIGEQGPFSFFFAAHSFCPRSRTTSPVLCTFLGRTLFYRTNRPLGIHTHQLSHAHIGRYPAILTQPLPRHLEAGNLSWIFIVLPRTKRPGGG